MFYTLQKNDSTAVSVMIIEAIENRDIDIIAPMWEALNQYQLSKTNHFRDHYKKASFTERKAELLAKQQLQVYLARDKAALLGFCVASVNSNIGNIESLYLKDEARLRGIGTQLLSTSLAWLSTQDVSATRLLVGDGNESAIDFYQKNGFVRRAVMLEL